MSHDALIDTPTEFQIAKAEVKKTIPAKDDKPAATILKLGLVAPDGTKVWPTEFYCRDGTTPPTEGSKETLVLKRPDNPEWALKASRPRSGGGGRGGAPKDTNSIEAQCAFKGAIELIVAGKSDIDDLAGLTALCAKAIRGAKA